MSGYAQTEETPRKTLRFSDICQIVYVRAYGVCRFFAREDDIWCIRRILHVRTYSHGPHIDIIGTTIFLIRRFS